MSNDFKVNSMPGSGGGARFAKYRQINYGNVSLGYVVKAEIIQWLCNGTPGALGLWLRALLFRSLFASVGAGVVFGRNITLRHARKIRIGDHVIIDDNVVLDAKGDTNAGITIGNQVYIGRNTIIYCKNGDIELGASVNIGSNCQIFSSNRITIGEGTLLAAFTYLISGGSYDYRDSRRFCEQAGTVTDGPLVVGPDTWIGAGVTVVDAACIGRRCVIGAGSVVTRPIPDGSMAMGVPARVVKSIQATGSV